VCPALQEETAINGEAGRPVAEAGAPSERPARATFREIFGLAEFRALWLAQLLSVVGDQLARVALTLLVFGQTHSPPVSSPPRWAAWPWPGSRTGCPAAR